MKLTISIEYAHDEDLPDITVEQVKKALQKFIVPSRSLHIYQAVEHSVQPTVLNARHKLVLCPQCLLVFDANSNEPHIG